MEPKSSIANIANLSKALVGGHQLAITQELYMRVAFLRLVAMKIMDDPDHDANYSPEKWWKEVDDWLKDMRAAGSPVIIAQSFLKILEDDIAKYGDPVNSGITTTECTAVQKIVGNWARRVELPQPPMQKGKRVSKRLRVDSEQPDGNDE
ncbi:hypothetical protein VKT23_007727 [Stygiomarasmius scandens]|uniref:Uncharacterized protein n=1 Tax=Marasmiellus scandens TaxID=2682957 RepID=A0ABR1JPE5_9AGAR